MQTSYTATRKGFSLLEMMVAMGIFLVVVGLAVNILIQTLMLQRKSAAIQSVVDNTRFTLELMTKEMRTGTSFSNASVCGVASESGIEFETADSQKRRYYFQGDNLMRLVGIDACANARPINGDEVAIDQLGFILEGESTPPLDTDGQPYITIFLRVRSRDPRFGPDTTMNLQTSVAARLRDL
ncbi:MAG: hypothetical protein G01um101466_213 [Parcubacteria group bacterium Gr01-1014_66]|nr:MAG: hypothetical protein G01um101466_213 [Parcubacteria group bacterium Gr01-1014_66]